MTDQKTALARALSEPNRSPGAKNSRFSGLAARCRRLLQYQAASGLLSGIRRMLLYRLHGYVFDRLTGSSEPESVARTTQLDSLTITGDHRLHAVEYTPTPCLVIDWIHGLVPGELADWTFVDVGAGRGRVVMMAAQKPYRRVLGIEFAAELQRDASNHVSAVPAAALMARDVAVINADATAFEVPDGACIFYLFNPFGAVVLRKFLANLIASHQRDPRQMRIAYYNPVHGDVMSEFRQIRRCPLRLSSRLKFALLSPHRFEMYELG